MAAASTAVQVGMVGFQLLLKIAEKYIEAGQIADREFGLVLEIMQKARAEGRDVSNSELAFFRRERISILAELQDEIDARTKE